MTQDPREITSRSKEWREAMSDLCTEAIVGNDFPSLFYNPLQSHEALARSVLRVLHGPPPGAERSRRSFGFASAEATVRAHWTAILRPRALRIRLEEGRVLWERSS